MKTVITFVIIFLVLGGILYSLIPSVDEDECKVCESKGGECVYDGSQYVSCKQYPHGNPIKSTLIQKPKLEAYHQIEFGLPSISL